MTKLSVMGVPLDLGAENLGVDIGPNAFRDHKIIEKLKIAGLEVLDLGNIECRPRNKLKIGNPKLKYKDEIIRVSEESAELAFKCLKKGEKILTLGGDHSACMGVISAASAAFGDNLGLIYLDYHGDINTEKTTLTGNIHGMPLALLMGYGDSELINIFKEKRKISKEHMLHIGGGDFDPGELNLIKNENLRCVKMTDVLTYGLKPLFDEIDILSKKVKNIWVSLDLDVIDEIYAPGVGMPNKGGFSYREITAIANYIGQQCNVVGIDVDEYNPLVDDKGKTAELGIELIAKILGKNYSWYTNYMEKNKV